ncbi:MAG: hypothetical protein Q4B28_01930 [bacterium]|nr:hypothetical protein [bacterium]
MFEAFFEVCEEVIMIEKGNGNKGSVFFFDPSDSTGKEKGI